MVTFVNYVVPLCCASPVGASEEVLHRIGVPVGERGSNSTTVVGGLLRFFSLSLSRSSRLARRGSKCWSSAHLWYHVELAYPWSDVVRSAAQCITWVCTAENSGRLFRSLTSPRSSQASCFACARWVTVLEYEREGERVESKESVRFEDALPKV